MRRFPDLGIGLGLRAPHFSRVLRDRPEIPWFEATTENYMGIRGGFAGRPLKVLEQIRRDHAVVLHGVSLNIGSTDPLDRDYLKGVRSLADRIEPSWISDHVCWTGVGGENLHDLLPLPYTRETLDHLVPRIREVQDFLGRRMIFENVSAYLSFDQSEMTEWEFLTELARRSDCGLLLDINNVYVSSQNLGFDPIEFLNGLPLEHVGQMHLAGHSRHGEILIDTHDHPVPDEVWALYRAAVARFPEVSAMIEWDAQIPEFEVLEAEARRARKITSEIRNALVEASPGPSPHSGSKASRDARLG